MLDLLNQIIDRCDRGEPLAVCTLVRTRGSTPQKAGAMMVVLGDGKTLGTIGGGCVEAEVQTRALRLLFNPADQLLSFKLDHDLGWDDGLVCGGQMDVAVQIVAAQSQAASFRAVRDLLATGNAAELPVTVTDAQDRPATFLIPAQPVPTLVIAGAGHVAAALATIATQLDYRVIVIDDRADYASPDRFPHATRIVGDVEVELGKLKLTPHTHAVIVTRGHRRDGLALSAVIRSNCGYVGLIGSRRKILTIYAELREQGVSIDQLRRVHAPIGLDLGAVTPGEIAVSIAAELIAVLRGAAGHTLVTKRLAESLIDRL